MKIKIQKLLLAFVLCSAALMVRGQGTAFTYQGRLAVNGVPANGTYSFQFLLRQTSNDAQQGPTLTTNGVVVSNGLFIARLDFGDYFGIREFGLEIGVRTNGGVGPFTILSPRQLITPTPLAIAANHAGSAVVADSVLASGLPSSVPQLDANAQMRVNGSVVVGTDPIYTQGFENVSFPPSGWSTGGSANWVRTNSTSSEGGFSAVSGAVGNTQLSYLDFVYDFPSAMLVKFDWKVSSALSDNLHFCVDGDCDTAGVNPISGEVNWTPVTISVPAGTHTLRWMFVKGETGSGANSRGWIDNVRFVAVEGNLQANGIVTALAFKGDGAGVSNVNAGTLTGTILDARLPANAARRSGGNAFTGNQTIAGTVGIGTVNPQGNVHVYSASNPTTMRIQSSAQPGAGRIEFLSDPQGSGSEWRPGYIQSTDNGGFTGGISFVVNGTGGANRFAEVETMRVVNGRVGIGTPTPASALQVIGTVTATAFNPPSDRNLKENFAPVSPREVLDKVAALPISSWNFKGDVATPHVGPMAQDFHAAFGLGTDDKHIATVDADGVALAAIQGLNQKVEEKDARIAALEKSVAELKDLVRRLAEKH